MQFSNNVRTRNPVLLFKAAPNLCVVVLGTVGDKEQWCDGQGFSSPSESIEGLKTEDCFLPL